MQVFKNDPFVMVAKAYNKLCGKPYEAFLYPRMEEEGYGYTVFPDDGSIPQIVIFADSPLEILPEIFAHELAHIMAGEEHEHDEVWEKAFSDIHEEYDRIGEEMVGEKE